MKFIETLGLLKNLPQIIDSMQNRLSDLTANTNEWTTDIIDEIKDDIRSVQYEVDDHDDRLDDLESEWESDIPRLFDRYNELENQLSIVEHKVETQHFEIETLKEQIKTLIEKQQVE